MAGHEETKAKMARLITSACKKDRVTKQDLAKLALIAMKYLEYFDTLWMMGHMRAAFVSYTPPYIVMLKCYSEPNKPIMAELDIHLRYAIVKIHTTENEVVDTAISFVGEIF